MVCPCPIILNESYNPGSQDWTRRLQSSTLHELEVTTSGDVGHSEETAEKTKFAVSKRFSPGIMLAAYLSSLAATLFLAGRYNQILSSMGLIKKKGTLKVIT